MTARSEDQSENSSPSEANEEPEQEVEAPKKHHKTKPSAAQQEKPLDPHSADAIGNAGDNVGDGADPQVDVDKEKA